MRKALQLLKSDDDCAAVVLDELLKTERKRLTKAGKLARRNFAANMISMALDEIQQSELYEILAGLPPSVLGDSEGMFLGNINHTLVLDTPSPVVPLFSERSSALREIC